MSESQALPPTRAMIGKWTVDRYVGLLRRWVLLAAIPILFITIFGWTRTWSTLIDIVVVVSTASLIVRRGGGKTETITAGVFVGVILGLVASIGRYIHHPTVTTGPNIIIETILTTVLAMIVAISAGLITALIKQQKN